MSKLLEPTDTAWLYVIGEPDGPYKVGFSTQPHTRCKHLRQHTKRELELLHWVDVPYRQARSIELLAHKKLRYYAATSPKSVEVVVGIAVLFVPSGCGNLSGLRRLVRRSCWHGTRPHLPRRYDEGTEP